MPDSPYSVGEPVRKETKLSRAARGNPTKVSHTKRRKRRR
jgi:hypothetical protein